MQNIYSFLNFILPFEWLSYDFMKNAFIATIFIGILFGFLGSMVVNNKMAFFSEALGHSALTGIGLGVILGISDNLYSMIIFAIFMSVVIWWLDKQQKMSTDTIIGVFSSTAIALGLVLLSRGGNFNKYSNYLIGDILSITPNELLLLLIMLVVIIVFWSLFFNRFILSTLNSSIAKSRKIKSDILKLVFILIIAIVVMVSIKWVGILIINSLLILPAATARNISKNMRQYTLFSILFSLFAGIAGIVISYYTNMPTGPMIVIILGAIFFITLALKRKIK